MDLIESFTLQYLRGDLGDGDLLPSLSGGEMESGGEPADIFEPGLNLPGDISREETNIDSA